MPIAEYAIALQTSITGQSQTNLSPAAGYLVIALVGAALGLIVLMFIRVNARRTSKRTR